ncbi:iron ABC transporter ATP-binding protein [Corynebacterium renale]|uniref:Iron complex transport system ATP-binding protein n=1 Tax=Corynebacterium renale TaxID=1724 RepID=A0A2A9DPD3_9CORY|nr:ABC transporter ATP-binding protein [Corynebacterium renale]PFG28035.1 iron complex transport system ATP-binding protein [Corynebacterium renale]SQG65378.1 iron ABC transporter ATP-binding protein [Corynebacterium renale]SQI21198.1 iron ABC transporter ATP-binding protein [Corynebacterium renale]
MVSVELNLEGLSTGYGSRTIVESLTASGLSGCVGLLGPNGSGKTTLLKTLAGVLPAISGSFSVLADGHPITARTDIGYVPQELPGTASLTALETVLVSARRAVDGDPLEATARTLTELGVGHVAQRYLGELSGGQRQIIAVAQMLVGRPKLMLLDEPTSALDLHRQLFILEKIRERVHAEGSVAMVSLHDMNLAARFCDSLIVMHGGAVTCSGHPRDVLTPETLREVYQVESEVLEHRGVPVIVAHSPYRIS